MTKTIEGVFRDGKVGLSETPDDMENNTPVIVMFLTHGKIDLREHGIDGEQAAELRARLASFVADWDSPEMDIYDDYD